VHFHCDVIRS